ncbi:hypothetical protein VY88_18735 [Azospirillum thiophilum]|uniref:Uncharacterized protein n=1 Tax=Azospirillum thiophilum TaxID=528244 RepID=A0AAC8W2V2_9PROT|nr:hypothetical protein [Azospirillum thiophilum]ALG74100.1 hypothetical protein AL072_24185 [Azospirillum thiophilum]KJR63561.1 hypothetical protein VY88_18735 [Azospirillum thiophilum]
MPHGTLDRETLEAVGVLARAVDGERVPGVLECRLLANALRRTLDSGRELELAEASRVFRTLDADLRDRIVARARQEARQARGQGTDAARQAVTQEGPAAERPAAAEPKARAGTNFLAALNGLRPAASSRNAARDRLRAAVDTQRRVGQRTEPTLD